MNWLKIIIASLTRQIEKLDKKKADRSVVERLEKNKVDKTDVAQSDWTVNDEQDPRYINGRTHYRNSFSGVQYALDVEIAIESIGRWYSVNVQPFAMPSDWKNTGVFTVIWDGVRYSDLRPGYDYENDGYVVGNTYSGQPFVIYPKEQDGFVSQISVWATTPGHHKFSFGGADLSGGDYVKITSEYLPPNVYENPYMSSEYPLWYDYRIRNTKHEHTVGSSSVSNNVYRHDLTPVPNYVGSGDFVVTINNREWFCSAITLPDVLSNTELNGEKVIGDIRVGTDLRSTETPFCIVISKDQSEAYIKYRGGDGLEIVEGDIICIQGLPDTASWSESKMTIPSAYIPSPLPPVNSSFNNMYLSVIDGKWTVTPLKKLYFIDPKADPDDEQYSITASVINGLTIDTRKGSVTTSSSIVTRSFLDKIIKSGSGTSSVVLNDKTSSYAYGDYSTVEGYNTVVGSGCTGQHVQGKYNVRDDNNEYAHIVGNGTSGSKRSNAHTLDWNGLGWFAGGLKVGGTGQDDEAAVEVALKTDIPTSIVKTVNNIEPDENGNVGVEIPEGFSGSWNDLTDKPFYVDRQNITRDSVTVGIYNLGYATLPFEFFPGVDENYTITWDNTSYECVAVTTTVDGEEVIVVGNTTFFGGNEYTNIPVGIISRHGSAVVYSSDSGEHTISLIGYELTPHKIPSEYVDRNPIVGVIDSSYYNYRYLNPARGASIAEVRNAAKEGDRDIIIRLDLDNWQGTLQYMGLTTVSTDGSDYASALLFSTIKANNVSINESDEIVNGTMQLEYWYTFLEPTEGPPADAFVNCQFAEINLAPGSKHAGSFMRVNEDGLWGVEKVDIITPPTTAEVGQVLVVKSIDEAGKPTEWGAVDGMVVASSTEGSTKRFKITVDDSGTLTATEVTD